MLTPPVNKRDHILGPPNAEIVVVEYGDFECPVCAAAVPVLHALREALPNSLLFAYRHFPMSEVHPHAQHAAEASEAAGAQGNFWRMHDCLFANQDALEDDELIDYAAEVGCDLDQFVNDMAENRYAARVREDFLSGIRSGVNGTPCLFINGLRYDGPRDLDSLLAATEQVAVLDKRQ
jgi:protein-disulfide isomerase